MASQREVLESDLNKSVTDCGFAEFNEMFEISKFIPKLPIDSWWFFGAVLAGLLVAIGLVIRFVSSKTDDIDPVEIDRQMLSSVKELTRTGEITDDEYRSIKGRLVERLKQSEEEGDNSETSAISKTALQSSLNVTPEQNETDSAIQQDFAAGDSEQANPST